MRRLACPGRDRLDPEAAAAVAAAVRAGGLVAFPTDTVYGLGADPLSADAVGRVFRAKGRDPGQPLPVLLADAALLPRFATAVAPGAAALIRAFWPGALTLLLPARDGLPPGIRSAAGEVALRVPAGGLCLGVLAAAGGALTGTSANASGAGPCRDPERVAAALGRHLDLLLDAGTLPPARVSTIVRIDGEGKADVLREGAVGREALAGALDTRRASAVSRG
jgi:L-threonylcarbamoyladenylate synthase